MLAVGKDAQTRLATCAKALRGRNGETWGVLVESPDPYCIWLETGEKERYPLRHSLPRSAGLFLRRFVSDAHARSIWAVAHFFLSLRLLDAKKIEM